MSATIERYTPISRWLHWIMAVLIIGVWIVGTYLADLPRGPEKSELIGWHKAFGSTVLLLVAIRLAWRLLHVPPPLLGTVSALQQKATHLAHWALYGLMFAQPISGWGMSSAFGYPVKIAGLIPLPALVDKNEALADVFKEAHEFIGWTLAILVLGHIAMALKHRLIDRDEVFARMSLGESGRDTDA